MKKYATVEIATELAIKVLEANYVTTNTESIRDRVYSWYSHSDTTDPEILAACALTGENWRPEATYEYMMEVKNYWFPKDPYEEAAIWEIENAQQDSIWW